MIDFLSAITQGLRASAPIYSHEAYDILPNKENIVEPPDILIFEGLNVLQLGAVTEPGRAAPPFTASDFFDLSIYIDAEEEDIERWYLERFMLLKRTAFRSPASYFHHLADASEEDARSFARDLWARVNAVNLRENILPSRARADLIIHKGPDHAASGLMLRRL